MTTELRLPALDSDALVTVSGGAAHVIARDTTAPLTLAMTQLQSSLDTLVTQARTAQRSSLTTLLPLMMMMRRDR